ncbi:MAG: glutathione S-transferase [Pseudomonadota bacterium]|nr:glutathione S-transferase [Pseudomonadota bacterium]
MIQLYRFRCSHFCEKASWALDYKGLAWEAVDLVPGRHAAIIRRLAPRSSVPLLRDGDSVVQGSSEIITYLDQRYEGPRLTPTEAQAASLALEWERYLESEVGVPLRLWFYHQLLPDREACLDFLLEGAPRSARLVYRFTWPLLRRRMRRFLKIDAANADAAEQRMRAAFDRLDGTLAQHRYLVAERFTRADLCAAALLSRLCLPPTAGLGADGAGPPPPEAIRALRAELQQRPFYRWIVALRAQRQPPA